MSTPPPPAWPPPHRRPAASPQAEGDAELNGFAPASLLVGLLCLPPLGIVLAVVALVQISRKGERGRPLALAGLAVSLVTTAAALFTVAQAAGPLFERLDALEQYESVAGELTVPEELQAGDCFNVPGGDLLDEDPLFYRIDCAEVHQGEVTSSTLLGQPAFPGGRKVKRSAAEACWRAQDAYAMDTWALPPYADMFYFAPSRESWGDGDRHLLCVLGTAEVEHRGSLRRDAGMLRPDQAAYLGAANEAELARSGAPDEDLDEALPAYREWARSVERALAREAAVLREALARPELAEPAGIRLKEVEASRAEWQRAGEAVRPDDFREAWERAARVPTVAAERNLRGAYGLATTVPDWLEERPEPGGPAEPDEAPEEAPEEDPEADPDAGPRPEPARRRPGGGTVLHGI
ncbi:MULTISPECIES: DUF4190 domain-containing protein [Streptomyces]|uniref:DUF4190 domain-containing protein n=1 Tax=Streptomyces TaxID=1883 RepID=UPI0016752FE3|nr:MULTISPECIES: septum formation family protein [Streptomyces]MBD3576555.1 DUF4190 domain-containing protein [Streptomyces sp. KD18]GGT06875.1 membrane protein [Streptomyces toxytricini]